VKDLVTIFIAFNKNNSYINYYMIYMYIDNDIAATKLIYQ